MLVRQNYLDWMLDFYDTPLIKVLTGIRRSGKSVLLKQFSEILKDRKSLKSHQILFVDKESLEFQGIQTAIDLHNLVESAFADEIGHCVLFVDEVQEIQEWEKALSSILKSSICDIYITGSNARLLSSDLATYLAGRYVEMNVYPFSYSEFLEIHQKEEHDEEIFQDYLTFGGFPGLTHLPRQRELLFQSLNALYSSIILRDVVERHQIRNADLLNKLVSFFFDNIGNLVSAKSIADFLKSQRIKASVETVQSYMSYLESCFAIHRVQRYDLKGKRFLEVSEKHYLNDIGLRHSTLGFRPGDIGQLLENLVYLELRRRGFAVSVGKLGTLEVDFIAEKNGQKQYIQVAYLLGSPETREREFLPLKQIRDAYPKMVVTMDALRQDEDGIQHLFLPEFLLSNK